MYRKEMLFFYIYNVYMHVYILQIFVFVIFFSMYIFHVDICLYIYLYACKYVNIGVQICINLPQVFHINETFNIQYI